MNETYSLGQLPWSLDELERRYFKDFRKTWEEIHEHPGFSHNREIELLRMSYQIFDQSICDFNEYLSVFHEAVHFDELFKRQNKSKCENIQLQIRKSVFGVACSAMALVNHSRRLSNSVEITGYKDKIKTEFATNAEHQFIQGLRNQLLHIKTVEPQWQLSNSHAEGKKTQFLLMSKELLENKEWNSKAKKYIQSHSNGICLEKLFSAYKVKVHAFNDWLCSELIRAHSREMTDYLRYEKHLKAIDARAWWNIILKQTVIASGLDPYSYIENYLSEKEFNKVNSYPHRSKSQVDFIINCIDEHGACNEELRKTVYEAFKINVS